MRRSRTARMRRAAATAASTRMTAKRATHQGEPKPEKSEMRIPGRCPIRGAGTAPSSAPEPRPRSALADGQALLRPRRGLLARRDRPAQGLEVAPDLLEAALERLRPLGVGLLSRAR